MIWKPGRHVYLAAAFFNDDQKKLCQMIEHMGHRLKVPIYSPRADGFVLEPSATNEQQKEIFDSNTNAIDVAAFVLAVVDDFDPGVLWEMGYAHARGVRTLSFSNVEGRGLNVMLAGSSVLGFVNGVDNLEDVFRNWWPTMTEDAFPMNTWAGEIQ